MKRRNIVELEKELFKAVAVQDSDYEYEDDIIDEDFAEDEKAEADDFDYDTYRMRMYDNYKGEITYEIAAVKYEALIRHYALEYCGEGAEYDVLVQEGLLKLKTYIEKCTDKKRLTAYLKKRLPGYIFEEAEKLREEANYGNRVSLDSIPEIAVEAVGYDWHERETEMFRRVKKLLTKNEMQILNMIYRGYSVRLTARIRNVSHTAIENSIARIRKKLMPLKPWLEDNTEFPCVNE